MQLMKQTPHSYARTFRRTAIAAMASGILFCAGCAGGGGSVNYMSSGLTSALGVDAQLQNDVAEYTFVNRTNGDLYVQYSLDDDATPGRWYRVHLMPGDEARVRHTVGEGVTSTPRVSVRTDDHARQSPQL